MLRISFFLFPLVSSSEWKTFSDTNAVDGCGMECVSNGPYVCLGKQSSASACAAACQGHSGCNLYTFSEHTGNCWTRVDREWFPEASPGVTSGCDASVVSGCAPPPPPNTPNTTVLVSSTVLGTSNPLHPAVALDFWRSDDRTFGEKWGNSSALTIDLASPVLRAAAKALSPALLRLGGSPEDSIVFDVDGSCVPGSGGDGPFAPYYCSQVHSYVYDCLTPARWEALLEFASATGLKIALGLNGCYGRPNASSPMDFSNARGIIEATAASKFPAGFHGFELTNEVVPGTITAEAWGKDAAVLKAMAATAFAAAGLPAPPMVGPDQSCCEAQEAVAASAPPGTLSALTYHEYPECTDPGASSNLVFSPQCLMAIDRHASGAVAAAGRVPSGPPPPRVVGGGRRP